MARKLLMISTDRLIFQEGSAVRTRQAEYAKGFDEVHIVVFTGRKNPKGVAYSEQVIAPNCWAYPTRSWFKALYPFDAISIGRFVIEHRAITDITTQDASLTAIAGVSLKKQSGLPLEIQVHEDIGSPHYTFRLINKIRKALALSHLPKADSVRVVSERIKTFLVGTVGISENKVTVRPIVVDTDAVKNAQVMPGADLRAQYPQFSKIVLMASRLEPEKNVALAIDSWAAVIARAPKAGLVIVGAGSQEVHLKSIVIKLGLTDSVVFLQWADRATLFSYYKTADIFLNTSLFEGYGMSLVEAHAAGLIVVSTDVGVAREMVAVVVETHDGTFTSEGVAEALLNALV